MHKYIKKYLTKILLTLAIIISASVFIPQEAYAKCRDFCTCDPYGPNAWARAWWEFDIDYTWACNSKEWGDTCEQNCHGHTYDEGPFTVNNIPTPYGWACEYEDWEYTAPYFCYRARMRHFRYIQRCSTCGQPIGYDGPDFKLYEWYEHSWQHHDDGYRHPWDPCQWWDHYYDECTLCHARQGEGDIFLWWSHNNGLHWAETGIKGDRSYHALWCNAHGWVNEENCESPPKQYGQYAGTWDNLLTPTTTNSQRNDGVLKYYYHNLSPTNYGDSMHYKCTDCGHTHSLACTLTSTRADNNTVIGRSNINTAFIPGANDAWTNTNVNLTAASGNYIINKNTSAWLGSSHTVTQEGTNNFYTYMSGHGNAVISKDHYVKIDKTAPKLNGTSVRAGTYQTPATTSTAHDSESYGLKVTLKADDSNANARGGANDVSKIKEAYVIVRDKDNANNSKRYNIDGVADKVSIDTSKVIDVNKDFHGVLDFVYEIHVIDYAGNDAVKTDTIIRNPEVFLSVKNVTQNTQLNGSNVFLGGEHGILTITTTGYCDISNLKWNNYTLKASEKDQEQNYPTMTYNTSVNMTPPNSDKSGFVGKNYIQLMDKDICYSTDSYTPDGGYTRIYEFRFWVPFNHEWTTDNGSKPYIDTNNKYPIEVTAVNNKYNRSATKSTLYKLVSGKITDKFRSSLVF